MGFEGFQAIFKVFHVGRKGSGDFTSYFKVFKPDFRDFFVIFHILQGFEAGFQGF